MRQTVRNPPSWWRHANGPPEPSSAALGHERLARTLSLRSFFGLLDLSSAKAGAGRPRFRPSFISGADERLGTMSLTLARVFPVTTRCFGNGNANRTKGTDYLGLLSARARNFVISMSPRRPRFLPGFSARGADHPTATRTITSSIASPTLAIALVAAPTLLFAADVSPALIVTAAAI